MLVCLVDILTRRWPSIHLAHRSEPFRSIYLVCLCFDLMIYEEASLRGTFIIHGTLTDRPTCFTQSLALFFHIVFGYSETWLDGSDRSWINHVHLWVANVEMRLLYKSCPISGLSLASLVLWNISSRVECFVGGLTSLSCTRFVRLEKRVITYRSC